MHLEWETGIRKCFSFAGPVELFLHSFELPVTQANDGDCDLARLADRLLVHHAVMHCHDSSLAG